MHGFQRSRVRCTLLLALLLILAGCSASLTASTAALQTNGGVSESAVEKTPSVKTTSPTRATHDTGILQPARLLVPSISINAPIEQVGILSNGELATPTQNPWENTGWYSDGPHPGERGSAVIDGHLDRPGGYPAVFWNLRYVHLNAPVYVIGSDGRQLRFHVTRISYYTPQDAPLQDIFGNRSGVFLNLITCAGDWIPSQHQTTLRL
ncbi:MAG TPA: class F sortase, partial [Ktedonobacteraceae bacterium]|nr:class F sortase [Ktedonobacteraceae bacterium]